MTDQNKPEDTIPSEGTAAAPLPQPSAPAPSSPRPSKATVSSSDQGPDELPYIDDPVSKWWIAIIVAVFALIFAWAILFGAGGLFEGVLTSDDPTPTPEATVVATLAPVTTGAPSLAPDTSADPALPSAQPEPSPAPAVPTLVPEPSVAPTTAPAVEPPSSALPAADGGPASSPEG
jgi:hypothetical protein